jgi:hypothetical protein
MRDVERALRAAKEEELPPGTIDRLVERALDEVGGVVA